METEGLELAFYRHLAQTSPVPAGLCINRAEGLWLYGPGGERWLDLISGISVSSLGHRHPEVLAAIQDQLERYLHTMVYGEYVLAPQVKLAQALATALGNGIDNFYLVNSGSEATEGALKLAKRHTGRSRILAFHHSYHGSTHGALSVTGAPDLKKGYGPFLPGVEFIPFGDFAALSAIDEHTACIVAEAIQGEAGVVLPPEGYFKEMRKRCDETGALLILDEVQTAPARTGHLFAHQRLGIVPDILLLAKGIGGGMPIGAFGARRELMLSLSHDPILGHLTTFGGHPVSCAAALATLQVIRREKLWERMPALEALIRSEWATVSGVTLRGKGLLFALDLGTQDRATLVMQACIRRGVVTDFFLHAPHCLRIAPPLIISHDELKWAMEQMKAAVNELN